MLWIWTLLQLRWQCAACVCKARRRNSFRGLGIWSIARDEELLEEARLVLVTVIPK